MTLCHLNQFVDDDDDDDDDDEVGCASSSLISRPPNLARSLEERCKLSYSGVRGVIRAENAFLHFSTQKRIWWQQFCLFVVQYK